MPEHKTSTLEITRLGGLTNLLYRVDVADHEQKPKYVYRIFRGELNRDIDNMIFTKLSESNIAPKLYFSNSVLRIEQLIEKGVHPPI